MISNAISTITGLQIPPPDVRSHYLLWMSDPDWVEATFIWLQQLEWILYWAADKSARAISLIVTGRSSWIWTAAILCWYSLVSDFGSSGLSHCTHLFCHLWTNPIKLVGALLACKSMQRICLKGKSALFFFERTEFHTSVCMDCINPLTLS